MRAEALYENVARYTWNAIEDDFAKRFAADHGRVYGREEYWDSLDAPLKAHWLQIVREIIDALPDRKVEV